MWRRVIEAVQRVGWPRCAAEGWRQTSEAQNYIALRIARQISAGGQSG